MFQQRHASESAREILLKKERGQLPCPQARSSVGLASDRGVYNCADQVLETQDLVK